MFPPYQELVKNSRRQQRRIKWRKFLCHRLRIHTWFEYWRGTCKTWCLTLFSQPFQTDAKATLQQCRYCPAERAVIDNGLVRQVFDADTDSLSIKMLKELETVWKTRPSRLPLLMGTLTTGPAQQLLNERIKGL